MEINSRNFPAVFDGAPPPLSGNLKNGEKAAGETEFAGIQMRAREGRMPGRASARRSPPRSLSESHSGSPTDSSLPSPSNSSRSPSPPSFRAPARSSATVTAGKAQQGMPRAASAPEADGKPQAQSGGVIDASPYLSPLTRSQSQQVSMRAAMSLDDPLPWNEKLSKKELAKMGDDGYATPPSEWRISPDVFDTGNSRNSIEKKTDDSNDGRRSAPPGGRSPRPQSMGGRSFASMNLAAAWKGGTLISPTSAGVIASSYGMRPNSAQSDGWRTNSSMTLPRSPARPDSVPLGTAPPSGGSMPILHRTGPSTPTSNAMSNASTFERAYVQTAIFGDPGTLASIEGTRFSSPSLLARLWRNVTYPPRALLSACRGLLQRMSGWFSGSR